MIKGKVAAPSYIQRAAIRKMQHFLGLEENIPTSKYECGLLIDKLINNVGVKCAVSSWNDSFTDDPHVDYDLGLCGQI